MNKREKLRNLKRKTKNHLNIAHHLLQSTDEYIARNDIINTLSEEALLEKVIKYITECIMRESSQSDNKLLENFYIIAYLCLLNISKDNNKNADEILLELNRIYKAKNHDYGDSFSMLRKINNISSLIRMVDKMFRIKQLKISKKTPKVEESIIDTYKDLLNYLIMEMMARNANQ